MKKCFLCIALFFAIAMTTLAQSYNYASRLTSDELMSRTETTLIAIKNVSGTNNYWMAGTSNTATFSSDVVFEWVPVVDGQAGSYYLRKLDGNYLQNTKPITLGDQSAAQVFTTVNVTQSGTANTYNWWNGDSGAGAVDDNDTEEYLVRFLISDTEWLNCATTGGNPTYNSGPGGFTIHNVYAVEVAEATGTPAEGFEQQITAIAVAEAENAPVSPDCTDGVVKVATYDVTAPSAGDVTVNFLYTSGEHKLAILGVDLLDAGGNVVYSDYHNGSTGAASHSNNNYTLSGVAAGNYTLRYFFCHKVEDHEVAHQQATITVTGLDLEPQQLPTIHIGNNSWVYSITENLPGTQTTHNINNVSVTQYRAETELLTCDDSINSIRYTVFETSSNKKYGNYPFFVLAELILLDEKGDTIKYIPTSNADHNTGGGTIDGAGLSALNDGNLGNYFHTSWQGNTPNDYHHIELLLEKPIQSFKLIWYTRPNQHVNPPTKVGITPGGIRYTQQYGKHEYSRLSKVQDINELGIERKYFTMYAELPKQFEYDSQITNGYGNTYIALDSFNVQTDSMPASHTTIQFIPNKESNSFAIYQPFKQTFYANNDVSQTEFNGRYGLQATSEKPSIIKLNKRDDGDFELSYKIMYEDNETDVWIGCDIHGKMRIFSREEKELLENAATTNDYSSTNFKYPVDFGFGIYNVSIKQDSITPFPMTSLYENINAVIDTLNSKIEKYGNHNNFDSEDTKGKLEESISNIETAMTENDLATIFDAQEFLLEKGYDYMVSRTAMYRNNVQNYKEGIFAEPPYTNEHIGMYPITSKDILEEITLLCSSIENQENNYTIYNIEQVYYAIELLFQNFEASKLKIQSFPCVLDENHGLPGTITSEFTNNLVWKSPDIMLNTPTKGIRLTFLENIHGNDYAAGMKGNYPMISIGELKLYNEFGNEIQLSEENFVASSTEENEGFDCGVARLCDGNYADEGYYHSQWSGDAPNEAIWIELTFPDSLNIFSIELYSRDKRTYYKNEFWLTPQVIYLSHIGEAFESNDSITTPNIETISLSHNNDTWNSANTELYINGTFSNNNNTAGTLYSSIDGTPPVQISELLSSGDSINITIPANFTTAKEIHSLNIYSLDENGNKLTSNIYTFYDVREFTVEGLKNVEYNGSPITMDTLNIFTTDGYNIEEGVHYNKQYNNNINAGTGNVSIDGIFPHSIGHSERYFTIQRATLSGEINIEENVFVYNGTYHRPNFTYTDERFGELTHENNYNYTYDNNYNAGTASIIISGIGNFRGQIEKNFNIDKADLNVEQININYSDDITYDGNTHAVVANVTGNGIGEISVIYSDSLGNSYTDAPSAIGAYNVSVNIAEGSNYKGNNFSDIASFVIYEFSDSEWQILEQINAKYDNCSEWTHKWDMTSGKICVSELYGLTIKKGHITAIDLSNNNIVGDFPYEVLTLPMLNSLNLSSNNINCDIGEGTQEFIDDNEFIANVKDINISNNEIEGNIGILTSCMPNLTTLIASNNCISNVQPTIPPTVRTLELSGQNIKAISEINMSTTSIENIISDIPTILLYNHAEQDYSNNISFLLEAIEWNAIAEYNNDILTLSPYENNIYKGATGDLIRATTNGGYANNSTLNIKFSFAPGDVDFNANINILDLQSVINFSFYKSSTELFNYTAANVYIDDRINVQDVVTLINLLLSQNISSAKLINSRNSIQNDIHADAKIYINENKLILSSSVAVAAADISLNYAGNINWKLPYGFSCTPHEYDNTKRAIIYSLMGNTIPAGETVLAELDSNTAVITNVLLADINAHEIKTSVGMNGTTGITSTYDNNAKTYLKNNSLYIFSDKELNNIEWFIYDMYGSIIANGKEQNIPAGNYKLSDKLLLNDNHTYIIKVTSDNTETINSKIQNHQ